MYLPSFCLCIGTDGAAATRREAARFAVGRQLTTATVRPRRANSSRGPGEASTARRP
jgi:hypothetical protein